MNNALFRFRRPENEHSMSYAPGCPERALLREAIKQMVAHKIRNVMGSSGKA